MHRNVIFTFGFIVYFIVMAMFLALLNFGVFSSAILLLAIPTYLLAYYSAAPRVLIVTVSCFAIGLSLLLEGVAHLYGLWSLSSAAGAVLPGGLTVEIVVVTSLKILFLVFFYELLFDDGEYTEANARGRLAEFGLFTVGALVLVAVFYFMFDATAEPSMYYWFTVILMCSSLAMLFIQQALSTRLVNKIILFAVVSSIPLLTIEYMLFQSGHKVVTDVLHPIALPLFTSPVPLGELLMAFAIPTFVTAIYELYLDDRA